MAATLLHSPTLNSPTIHRLPNGLTIIAEQMPLEVVNLNVWLNVGSVVETNEINGMAHYLEHMVFKGTKNLKSGEFERLIEAKGAITNAATSQEYTHYYITTAPRDFAELAPLQLDVVLNAQIADEAFERERLVILEEIRRSQDNPRRRIYSRTMETCFNTLPYRRPVLGLTSVIEQLTPQQMRDFHSSWYQPSNMTAAVVGNLPVEQLIEIVAQSTDSQITSLSSSVTENLHPEAQFNTIVRSEYEDESLQQARLVMVWRAPGLKDLDQTYALDVLALILGQGKISRLFRELREEKGLVSSISASNSSYNIQGIFSISAQLPVENIAEVEEIIINHLRQIQADSITETELKRISTQVANRFVFSNERPSDRANLYGYYYSQLGTLEPALNYPSYIQSLDSVEIQQAAQQYLSCDAYGVIVVKPTV
ncbi:pitrilysin family protein [Chroococcus sp. FPU101]|uniref:M16 family metallopeptidase n=1 Tax=Chroococcus sp. FPU101 TaxID=1974212 RepID=UPI001A8DD33E|nr:pitrilysin family protein [Chroococcus sp. FPU101]GFE69501.1 peptidase M16 domain protein [Chroococcus sp. FPU101]